MLPNKDFNQVRIFKYPLVPAPGLNQVKMPIGAEVLHAAMQGDVLCIWAKVLQISDQDYELREIAVVGTGHIWSEGEFRYIGTVQAPPFVWHVLERMEIDPIQEPPHV